MIQGLKGFRDFYPEDCARRNFIFRQWRQAAARFAFQEFDAPVLEPLELLTAKSGPEIASQLFHFEDKGGRAVTLRPELTPSLARMVSARAGSLKRPIKWFNIGEHYRYERQQKGRLRAFYQFNADILGHEGVAAEAELLGLLVQSLELCGLKQGEFEVRLSDRQVWWLYLQQLGLDEAAIGEVLAVVDKWERVPREVSAKQLSEKLGLGDTQTASLLEGVERFLALRDIDTLAEVLGQGEAASERLTQWRELLARLQAMGLAGLVKVNLGIVRGLAYYTGFVFEAFQTVGQGRALAGGGRYDELLEKLGGTPLPAVGFGLGDVVLCDLLEALGRLPMEGPRCDVYVIAGPEVEACRIVELAQQLRCAGLSCDYHFGAASLKRQFKQADQHGATWAVILGPEELARGTCKIKHMLTGQEQSCSQRDLLELMTTAVRGA